MQKKLHYAKSLMHGVGSRIFIQQTFLVSTDMSEVVMERSIRLCESFMMHSDSSGENRLNHECYEK